MTATSDHTHQATFLDSYVDFRHHQSSPVAMSSDTPFCLSSTTAKPLLRWCVLPLLLCFAASTAIAGLYPASIILTNQLGGINGILLEKRHHRLYVGDQSLNRVVVYQLDESNNITNPLPDFVIGQPDWHSSGETNGAGGLAHPVGLAYDSARDLLFVADYNNNRVLLFDAASVFTGMAASSVLGQTDFGTGATGRLTGPIGLAYDDQTKTLYVSEDGGGRLSAFGLAGDIHGLGDKEADRVVYASAPRGLAIDRPRNRIYVSEPWNHRVAIRTLDTFEPVGLLGTNAGFQLSFPYGVVVDEARALIFVAEEKNNRVSIFSAVSPAEDPIELIGQPNFTTTNFESELTCFGLPHGLDWDAERRRLYVSDFVGARLLVFDLPLTNVNPGHVLTNFPVNLPIPDGTLSGLTDVRTLATPIRFITGITVRLKTQGDSLGDLYCLLSHGPDRCVLLNRPGRRAFDPIGNVDAGLYVTFEDAAPAGDIHNYRLVLSGANENPIMGQLTGTWVPDGRTNDPNLVLDTDTPVALLNSFLGKDPNGVWTITIADLRSAVTNLFLSWALDITGLTNTAAAGGQIQRLTYGTNGMAIEFKGLPGFIYLLQRCNDFHAWSDIWTLVPDGNGVARFTDVEPPSFRAFYRTTLQPLQR